MGTGPDVEGLVRESSARLGAWFERQTRSASDAEDLLQETFLRVHERLDTLVDAASARAWLGTIARNVLQDHRRRAARAGHAFEEEPAEPEPEAGLERTVAGWLEATLAELEPADAAALRQVDLEGGSHAELARREGLTLSGAKSRVQRARVRLRERLEACCAFAFDARGGLLDVRRRSDLGCGDRSC